MILTPVVTFVTSQLEGTALAFTVDPPVTLARSPGDWDLAAGGDAVTITWTGPASHDIRVMRSSDRGLTFGPEEVVAHVPPTLGPWRRLHPHPSSAVALSADGSSQAVLSSVDLVDDRVPPLGSSPWGSTPATFFQVGVWRDGGARWWPSHDLDFMTDRCDAPGRRCMHLMNEMDLALDDTGDTGWATYAGWDRYMKLHTGDRQQVIAARFVRGAPLGAATDLSPLLLANDDTAELPTGIATNATGDQVFVSFSRDDGTTVDQHLAASVDAGVTWTDQRLDTTASAVDYARDADLVVWTTIEDVSPDRLVRVRTSADGGATFGPPVTAASMPLAPTGTDLDPDHVRVAVSRDGSTIAVAYAELDCQAWSCGNPHTVDVVVSEDGGATWSSLLTLSVPWVFDTDLAIAPDGDAIYATTASTPGRIELHRATRP